MPSPTSPVSIHVDLAHRSYDVLVGAGLLESLGARLAAMFGQGRRAFLIYDAGLPDPLVIAASRSLAHHGFQVSAAGVHADETHKSLGAAAKLFLDLAGSKHERNEPIVALGGGVTGDVAGFVAASYRRGVPVVQCPTTLLSMVDASVGGKTGVNLLTDSGLLKNVIGAFWQPRLVLADVATLATLPDRHLRAGLAECIKHGMLGAMFGDAGLFDWTAGAIPRALAREEAALVELVARNVGVKARVVAGDEREETSLSDAAATNSAAPDRALLNLGHTFGHAIEPLATLSPDGNPANAPLQHGEAVGLGLLAACACGEAMEVTEPGLKAAVSLALKSAGLPAAIAGLPETPRLIEGMTHDKKVAGGRLRLVLPTSKGVAKVVANPPMGAVEAGIHAIRAR